MAEQKSADRACLDTTDDAFLGGKLQILQPKAGPRAAIDAIFLAATCPAQEGRGERVLEAGGGCGIVSLALASRVQDATAVSVEIAPELVEMGRANARRNGFGERVRMVCGDAAAPVSRLASPGLTPESFHHVMANPPFYAAGSVRSSALAATRRAYMAEPGELELWIKFLAAFAMPKATITLIHRPQALPELLDCLGRRFGNLVIFPMFPRAGEPAGRVLVQGVKASRAPLRLARGIVLHREDGRFTDAAEAVLRHGEALPLI